MGEGARGSAGEGDGDDAPQSNLERLTQILDKFEITIAEANDLVILSDYEMVIIVDDSGSMSMASCPPHMRKLGEHIPTRWDELRDICGLLADLGNCFDDSGLDFYFLNRSPILGVKGPGDLSPCFLNKPSGSTPLTECLRHVVKECQGEKPILLFILTDGVPNGGAGPFIQEIAKVVKKKTTSRSFKIQIMACTDDDEAVGWMNELDEKLGEVDVTDDYHSEKAEVLNAGRVKKFTRGDWLIKAMLGPVSAKFDAWDEGGGNSKKKGVFDQAAQAKKGGSEANASSCCIVQ